MLGALTRIALVGVVTLLSAAAASGASMSDRPSSQRAVASVRSAIDGRPSPPASIQWLAPTTAREQLGDDAVPQREAVAMLVKGVTRPTHHRLRYIGIGIVVALLLVGGGVWLYTRDDPRAGDDAD